MLGIGLGINKLRSSGLANYLKGAMVWGFKSKFKWSDTSTDIWGFANPNTIDPEAQAVYDRIIADGGVSNLTRLNYFVVGLKTIYGSLANVPVCYDAHWIGYKLGSGTGATAGQAAAKLYSLTVAGDAVQATAASQPLLLAHNGASSDNYWWGSGVAGNYNSTPNAAANQITGDIEIIVKANINNDATNQAFVAKYLSSSQFLLRKNSSNFIQFIGSKTSGAEDINGTSTATISSGVKWVKVTRQASSGNMYFYTSPDGVAYTQLGSMVSTTSGNLVNGTDPINVGVFSTTGNPYLGGIYRLTIANSIGGTPVVDFNPATYNASTSQTAWTSATGEVWTINTGTATTGYKGVLVDRTIVMYDRTDDNLLASNNATLNTVLGTDHSSVLVATRYTTTNNEFLIEVGGDYTDINSTQWWLSGGLLILIRTNKGITAANANTTNNYALAKSFSYADSVVFGGTSIQLINASSNSGSYWNNTTNKPIPNTGLLLGKSAGIGNFNGIISTIIIGNDPAKYLLTKELARSLNNNFAL